MRCPDCAGTRSSTAANPSQTLVAAGAGLAVAAVVGVGWGFFPDWGFYWTLLLGFGTVETMVRFLPKPLTADTLMKVRGNVRKILICEIRHHGFHQRHDTDVIPDFQQLLA